MGSDQQYTFNNSIISCLKILRTDELMIFKWLKKDLRGQKMADQGRFHKNRIKRTRVLLKWTVRPNQHGLSFYLLNGTQA